LDRVVHRHAVVRLRASVDLADLDGDGKLEIYVASEDQAELRQYVWRDGKFVKTVLAPLHKGDITWNVTHGKL
jgi:hypothetical protein